MNKKGVKITISALFLGLWLRVTEKSLNLNLIPEWLHKPVYSIGAIIGSLAFGGYLLNVLEARLTNEKKNNAISNMELTLLKQSIYGWITFTSIASILLIHNLENALSLMPLITVAEFGLILLIFRGLLIVNMEYKIMEIIFILLLLAIVSLLIWGLSLGLPSTFH